MSQIVTEKCFSSGTVRTRVEECAEVQEILESHQKKRRKGRGKKQGEVSFLCDVHTTALVNSFGQTVVCRVGDWWVKSLPDHQPDSLVLDW